MEVAAPTNKYSLRTIPSIRASKSLSSFKAKIKESNLKKRKTLGKAMTNKARLLKREKKMRSKRLAKADFRQKA